MDEKKLHSIQQAVIDLVYEEGLSKLTTAKVAKRAGVSPATLYLHYSSKEDMLSRIYEQLKELMHEGLGQVIEEGESLEHQLRAMLHFSLERYRSYPRQARFIQVLWESRELLDERAVDSGLVAGGALEKLYLRMQQDPAYRSVSPQVSELFLSIPVQALMRQPDLGDEELDVICSMAIAALKTA